MGDRGLLTGCGGLQMAAAVGGLTWLSFDMAAQQQSLLGLSCGVLAGLVAITPAMPYVSIVGAMVMGLVASTVAWCAPASPLSGRSTLRWHAWCPGRC